MTDLPLNNIDNLNIRFKPISEDEIQALLQERQQLLDKKFADTLTRKDFNRLTYVRWSLDRIEDAIHGDALDMLEEHIGRYERFLGGVENFYAQLTSQTSTRKKPR